MKPTKALILFLAPLALAACSSDPEWADPEAHEKNVELQERYAPLLVGTWHVERIGEKQRYFEKLTFSDSRNDIVGCRGTFTGLRKWQTRQLVTINGEERYTDWQDVEGENGTFTGTWQLVWERNGSEGDGRNIISLSASFDDETTLSQLYYNAYSLYATLYSLTDKSLCFSGGFVHNGENDETVFTRDDAELSF